MALTALGWLWWHAWFPVDAVVAALFAWQASHLATSTSLATWTSTWRGRRHLVTSTCILRGKRGTYGTGLALGFQWTPLSPRLFAWQAWHLSTWTSTWRGKRGTWQHRRAFCVAGVALTALGWLWWRAWFPVDAVVAAAICVASVALGDMDLHLAWQAKHSVPSTCILRGRRGRRCVCATP